MNTLLWVALIVEAPAGMGFLLVPGAILGPMGVTLGVEAMVFARLLGSALIGFSVLLWLARRSNTLEFKKATLYSLLPYYLACPIVLAMAQLAGMMNAMGWSLVGVHVILLVWVGYYVAQYIRPGAAAQ